MIIATTGNPTSSLRMSRPQTACEIPGPTPDEIALSRIDTAQEAVQTPILEPTFQYCLALGLAAVSSPDSGLTAFAQASNYSNGISLRQGVSLLGAGGTGAGEVGSHFPSTSELRFEGEDLLFTERFGETETSLRVTRSQEGSRVCGTVGTVCVDLTQSLLQDDKGFQLLSQGNVGGLPYNLTLMTEGSDWKCEGALGEMPISKRYRSEEERDESGQRLVVRGTGENAGMPQSILVSLSLAPKR